MHDGNRGTGSYGANPSSPHCFLACKGAAAETRDAREQSIKMAGAICGGRTSFYPLTAGVAYIRGFHLLLAHQLPPVKDKI